MAIVSRPLGSAQGADLYMILDDVLLKLKQIRLDATNAIGPVIVTVYATDGVTPVYQETFQPGVDITRNIPGNADYTLTTITNPRTGVQSLALTAPAWKIEGA